MKTFFWRWQGVPLDSIISCKWIYDKGMWFRFVPNKELFPLIWAWPARIWFHSYMQTAVVHLQINPRWIIYIDEFPWGKGGSRKLYSRRLGVEKLSGSSWRYSVRKSDLHSHSLTLMHPGAIACWEITVERTCFSWLSIKFSMLPSIFLILQFFRIFFVWFLNWRNNTILSLTLDLGWNAYVMKI